MLYRSLQNMSPRVWQRRNLFSRHPAKYRPTNLPYMCASMHTTSENGVWYFRPKYIHDEIIGFRGRGLVKNPIDQTYRIQTNNFITNKFATKCKIDLPLPLSSTSSKVECALLNFACFGRGRGKEGWREREVGK